MTVSVICMGKIKLTRFPNTFRIEFSRKEFVCNKGHYSLDNIEQKKRRKEKCIKLTRFQTSIENCEILIAEKSNHQYFYWEQIRKSIQGHWVMSGPSTWRDTPHHPSPHIYHPVCGKTYTNTNINTYTVRISSPRLTYLPSCIAHNNC